MEKAKKILGEPLVNETIDRIEGAILPEDPNWLIEQRIEHEVHRACKKKPLTFDQMENIVKIYKPSNGLEISELCERLKDFTSDRSSLIEKNLAIINHAQIAVCYGITNDFKSYFRRKGNKNGRT